MSGSEVNAGRTYPSTLLLRYLPVLPRHTKMEDWKAAFREEGWDAVILGTGMKECLLSGLLSVAGKKVLHLDRNPYYGGASASLTIDQLFQKFGVSQPPSADELGKLRDYNIDLVPKFIMAG